MKVDDFPEEINRRHPAGFRSEYLDEWPSDTAAQRFRLMAQHDAMIACAVQLLRQAGSNHAAREDILMHVACELAEANRRLLREIARLADLVDRKQP